MFKKLSLLLMACTIAFSFTAPFQADAAYRSSKKSFNTGSTTQTPNSGVNKSEPAASSKTPNSATTQAPAQKPGLFGGAGGFMKGMMIGGLAGMLFGGLFGGMGFLGDMLGMIVNILAIVVLIAVIRKVFVYFRDRRKMDQEPRRY